MNEDVDVDSIASRKLSGIEDTRICDNRRQLLNI